jgi:hypothetical protein
MGIMFERVGQVPRSHPLHKPNFKDGHQTDTADRNPSLGADAASAGVQVQKFDLPVRGRLLRERMLEPVCAGK